VMNASWPPSCAPGGFQNDVKMTARARHGTLSCRQAGQRWCTIPSHPIERFAISLASRMLSLSSTMQRTQATPQFAAQRLGRPGCNLLPRQNGPRVPHLYEAVRHARLGQYQCILAYLSMSHSKCKQKAVSGLKQYGRSA
jgi:hypothetical protein